MDVASLAGAAVTGVCTVVVAALGLWASARLKRSEQAQRAAEAEASKATTERELIDARYERLVDGLQKRADQATARADELQEENDQLWSRLRDREGRA